jgi:hypothetical protein
MTGSLTDENETWIDRTGRSDCPVSLDTVVDVRLSMGLEFFGVRAAGLTWSLKNDPQAIVAYRLAATTAPAEWAVKLARLALIDECQYALTYDKDFVAAIASAIEAAANAATERAAVVAEQFSQSAHIAYSMRSGDFPKIARIEDAIAAAIRKGGENGG